MISNQPFFYKHICKPNNFLYLNSKNVIYLQVADIVWKYLEQDEHNFDKIRKKLIETKKVFQFVYSSVYPEIYSFVEKRGIDLRNAFQLKFKEWKDKKKYSQNLLMDTSQNVRGSATSRWCAKKACCGWRFWKGKKIGRWTKTKRDRRKKTTKKKNWRKIAAKNRELKIRTLQKWRNKK